MLLIPTRLNTQRFSWNAVTQTFSAEISDFGPNFKFGQVWDDACDEGLTLVSDRTGKEVVFAVDRYEEREGELIAWHLKPAKAGDLPGCRIVIFND